MSTNFDAVFSSWPAQPWVAVGVLLTAAIYLRGWRSLRRRDREGWNAWYPAAFLGGLITIYLALASPIEAFAPFLLQVHMLQHLLLMMVAPPLVWLGAPMFPLLRGLPREIRRYWFAPLFHWRPLRSIAAVLTHPLTAWIVFVACTWLWHLPPTYQMALENDTIHKLQHTCFLMAGLLFWYPVVRPFPARPQWSLWWLAPFLLLADIQNTLLAAWLTFSDQVLYGYYSVMPRLGGISALDDQSAAGVLMWIPGSLAFLAPLVWLGMRLMQSRKSEVGSRNGMVRTLNLKSFRPPTSDLRPGTQFDILAIPFIGPLLRSRWTRRIVQFAVLLIVVAVIVDGFSGPQVGPMNLAGVVPWIHWRWLVAIGLLVAGNVFCYGCPFMLPRSMARYWFGSSPRHTWPKWLRTKWLAVGLMALFLWSYEAFSLWNRPLLTAWIAIAYFVGALLVDSIFRDAAFCKFVCPIGQFHFVQSVISPLEVRVREPAVCTSCRSHDCLQGRPIVSLSPGERAGVRGAAALTKLPGCELHLFLPRKSGNLDCTFCLDCIRACPQDNVGLISTLPATTLWRDGPRSGIGRLSHRLDYAALAAVLVFGAFVNAAGMTRPVVEWQESVSKSLGLSSPLLATTLFYVVGLFVAPVVVILAAAAACRRTGWQGRSLHEIAARFVWSLVPLGFAMWLAHYSFHFFTGFDSIIPVTQRFAAGFGYDGLGPPDWICSCCRPAPDWLLKLELLILDVGLLTSLYTAWRIARSQFGPDAAVRWQAFRIATPWIVLLILLFALGVWILFEPMEMRGMLSGG
jgi:cytochrome c oxidase assembly factor CtaG